MPDDDEVEVDVMLVEVDEAEHMLRVVDDDENDDDIMVVGMVQLDDVAD